MDRTSVTPARSDLTSGSAATAERTRWRESLSELFVVFAAMVVATGLTVFTSLGLLIGAAMLDTRINRATLHASTSPDGAQRLVVMRRREWFGGVRDPRVELWVEVQSVGSGAIVDQLVVSLVKKSDVGAPSSTWTSDAVRVTGLERRHEMSATLRRSRPSY